jgi:hypothetical protein
MLSAPAVQVRAPKSQLVAPIVTDPGQIGILTPDGIIRIDPAIFGTALRASLAAGAARRRSLSRESMT